MTPIPVPFSRHRPRADGARAAPGRARRVHDAAQPDGGLRASPATARSSAKAGTSARAGRTRRCSRCRPPATARAAPPPTSRWSPARTPAAPAPCADALVAAGVARVVGGDARSVPAGRRRRFRQAARGRDRGRTRADGSAGARTQPRLPVAHRARPAVAAGQAGDQPGRPHRAGVAAIPSGSAAKPRATTCSAGARARRAADRRRHRAGRRSAADRAAAATAATVRCRRCGWCWIPGLATVARGRVREGDAPTLYIHAPDARLPRGLEIDRVRGAGAGRPLRPATRCCGCWPRAASTRCSSRPAPPWPVPSSTAGLVDELLLYVAPVLLGERARPLFDGLHIDAMAAAPEACGVIETRRIGEDVRLLLRPEPA